MVQFLVSTATSHCNLYLVFLITTENMSKKNGDIKMKPSLCRFRTEKSLATSTYRSEESVAKHTEFERISIVPGNEEYNVCLLIAPYS